VQFVVQGVSVWVHAGGGAGRKAEKKPSVSEVPARECEKRETPRAWWPRGVEESPDACETVASGEVGAQAGVLGALARCAFTLF